MSDSAAAEAKAGDERKRKRWLPLESNPELLNNYMKRLGLKLDVASFTDVFAPDDWALAMVPRPVHAVVFLFPIKEATEKHKSDEEARIKSDGQTVSDKVFYMKQYIGNACGTIALLHAAGNMPDMSAFEEGSFLARFVSECKEKKLTPEQIADKLEDSEEVEASHGDAAQEGQSSVPSLEDSVETHFICFTHVDGSLYELDGRKAFPINHGSTTADTLLEDACAVCRQFIARDEGELRFTIIAMTAPSSD